MPFSPPAHCSGYMSPARSSMPRRQDEPRQGGQHRIHPVNGRLKSLDLLVIDGSERLRQRRPGGCRKPGSDMKQGGLDLLYLPSHVWILVGQRCSQRPENGIKLVYITASLQPLVRLAHTLTAEKASLASIACACIDLNGSPPRFSISLRSNSKCRPLAATKLHLWGMGVFCTE